jgi:DNA ligase (NAD+)
MIIDNKINKIKTLTEELLYHCNLYYNLDAPEISDAEYDKKFDELKQLEDEANFWLANSPTRKVQGEVLDGFKKVAHSKPMLSAAKTKSIDDIKKFIGDKRFYCSYKLDGLTMVVKYNNGQFIQAITRGTGFVGEDVTEQAKMILNLPMTIPYKDYLELRGECVVSWDNFHQVNETLDNPYSHPRNFAAGALRNLDTNITKQRKLSYVVFECVSDLYDNKWYELYYLKELGFTTVTIGVDLSVEDFVKVMTPEIYPYPVDGLVFEMTSKKHSKSLASTAHHEGCRMALKWADSTYETILRDVVWDVGRSGVISPVAVFDEVDLDGALTTKATLHNLSIIENLELGIGDIITVYRSNMVIPKIDDNLTRSNTLVVPDVCPCCKAPTEIKYTDNSKFLMCTNPNCYAKTLAKFTHFASRNCMNIDGLSEKTLEMLIAHKFIHSFKDIYHLKQHKSELVKLDGLGEKSVSTLLQSIENSRNVKLENFICALSIDGVGLSTAKTIAKFCNGEFLKFNHLIHMPSVNWYMLEDIGPAIMDNLNKYFKDNCNMITDLGREMRFVKTETKAIEENSFNGLKFCITGSFSQGRDILKEKLEAKGAKFISSVSKNIDVLFCGKKAGSKLDKANSLGIKVVYEQELMNMLED